jgi:hypothetical protein
MQRMRQEMFDYFSKERTLLQTTRKREMRIGRQLPTWLSTFNPLGERVAARAEQAEAASFSSL